LYINHRRIGHNRRSKHRKLMASLKLMIAMPLRQPFPTLGHIFWDTNNALFATESERTASDVHVMFKDVRDFI